MKKQEQATRWFCQIALTLILAFGAASVLTAEAADTRPIVGDWNGAIATGGGSLRVVVHIAQDKNGELTATMDSPDQGASGIPISTITFKQPTLHFEIQKFGAGYDGTLSKDNSEIAGNWKQGGASLPLTLKRVSK